MQHVGLNVNYISKVLLNYLSNFKKIGGPKENFLFFSKKPEVKRQEVQKLTFRATK